MINNKTKNIDKKSKFGPETESRHKGDHELGNHEMRGLPVYVPTFFWISYETTRDF